MEKDFSSSPSPSEIPQGSGDHIKKKKPKDKKPIKVRIVDKATDLETSIHELTRSDINLTLNNLREFLRSDESKKEKSDSENPATTTTNYATTSGASTLPEATSETLGFLPFSSQHNLLSSSMQESDMTETSEESSDGKCKIPWILETPATPPGAPKPSPLLQKSRSSSEATPSTDTGTGTGVKSSARSSSDTACLSTPEEGWAFRLPIPTPTFLCGETATDRFQRFLEKSKRRPFRAGIKIKILPKVDTAVMAQIQECYERNYQSQYFNYQEEEVFPQDSEESFYEPSYQRDNDVKAQLMNLPTSWKEVRTARARENCEHDPDAADFRRRTKFTNYPNPNSTIDGNYNYFQNNSWGYHQHQPQQGGYDYDSYDYDQNQNQEAWKYYWQNFSDGNNNN